MFGYIKVDRANLLGKEYEAYKSIYCALCKQLGRDYSMFARFILSYDCTFYAMLGLSLSEEQPCYTSGRCRFNPLKKCTYACTSTPSLSMAAALSVCSAYYKLKDNIIDSPWYKRVGYRMIQPIFSRWRRKAAKKYPQIDAAVAEMMNAQLAAESDAECVLDQACEPTAFMLSAVCGMLADQLALKSSFDQEKTTRILSTFGYYLGRWIYLIDAADDYEKDKKQHNFNPFLLSDVPHDKLYEVMLPTLNHALSEALLSYGLLPPGRFDSIIMNVLRISCVKIQEEILEEFRNTTEN